GIRIRGNIGEKFGFFADARNTKEWGSREYPRGEDISGIGLGWVNNFVSHQYHDEVTAYAVVGLNKYFEFEFGKLSNRWGPGYRGGLLLNDHATSYDQVKLKSRFWRIKFVHLFGSLVQLPRIVESVSDESTGSKKNYAMKYVSAHRLELNLFEGFDIALHESIIYGQREIELSYLNPLMFFWSAEHYLGDQDNSLLGLEFELYRFRGWKIYGELLIDDIMTKELGTDWFGNKFGNILGALWTDPFKIQDTTFRIEYTRIKPFVYTHKFAVNKYKNFLTGLGHSLPPNSDEWYVSIDHYFSRKLRVRGELIRQRHGANPPGENVGGDIDLAHRNNIDRDYIGFLEGEVEKTTSVKIRFSYEPLRNLFIRSYYNILSGKNFRINNIPEQDFDNKKFFLGISLNY
ncbi:MAG: capsule assembly Wzi family protein, partial [bacterium]|nr:capsule assembly Wzi family protein [bacterium]